MNQALAQLVEKVTKENKDLRFKLKDVEFCQECHQSQDMD